MCWNSKRQCSTAMKWLDFQARQIDILLSALQPHGWGTLAKFLTFKHSTWEKSMIFVIDHFRMCIFPGIKHGSNYYFLSLSISLSSFLCLFFPMLPSSLPLSLFSLFLHPHTYIHKLTYLKVLYKFLPTNSVMKINYNDSYKMLSSLSWMH